MLQWSPVLLGARWPCLPLFGESKLQPGRCWGITEPGMCLCQCCSLDLLAKLLRWPLVIKRRIGFWSLRAEPCLLQLPPRVPSIPIHQETSLGMELEKIVGALRAVQSFEPECEHGPNHTSCPNEVLQNLETKSNPFSSLIFQSRAPGPPPQQHG